LIIRSLFVVMKGILSRHAVAAGRDGEQNAAKARGAGTFVAIRAVPDRQNAVFSYILSTTAYVRTILLIKRNAIGSDHVLWAAPRPCSFTERHVQERSSHMQITCLHNLKAIVLNANNVIRKPE
jgi:hypothetical protein